MNHHHPIRRLRVVVPMIVLLDIHGALTWMSPPHPLVVGLFLGALPVLPHPSSTKDNVIFDYNSPSPIWKKLESKRSVNRNSEHDYMLLEEESLDHHHPLAVSLE
jgi:hypothetical protein